MCVIGIDETEQIDESISHWWHTENKFNGFCCCVFVVVVLPVVGIGSWLVGYYYCWLAVRLRANCDFVRANAGNAAKSFNIIEWEQKHFRRWVLRDGGCEMGSSEVVLEKCCRRRRRFSRHTKINECELSVL